MVFIDNIAYSLFALSFAGFILLYTITSIYLAYRKNKSDFSQYLRSASIPLGIIGAYMVVMGLWGQFNWPLPGSYNILFYDPFVSFGILLLGFALSVKYKTRLEYVGFFGLLVGIMVLIYGVEGYSIGLTSAPLALLGLYFLYGAAGILSFPVSLIVERFPGLKKNHWLGWYIILALFWILLLMASLLAAYIGSAAIPMHLLSAP